MKRITAILPTLIFFLSFYNSFAQDSLDAGSKIATDLQDDSIVAYRQDRDFGYIYYLDSLLRQTKNLAVDTFSVNAADRPAKQPKKNSESQNIAPRESIFSNSFVKILLWALAIFFVSFILYRLFLADTLFRKNPAPYTSEKQDEEEQVSEASAYDRLIAQAVMNKNFRLAVRYLYLQTLQILTDRGCIQFSPDKTNYQYINELRNKPYQNDFAAITLNYEYVWYGKFEVAEPVYHKLSKDFKTFHQKL